MRRDWVSRTVLLILAFAGLSTVLPETADAQWTWTPQTGRWVNVKRMPKETAELQVEYARSLMMDGNYDKAWGETQKFVEFYGDTDLSDQNQFLRGEIRQLQGKYIEAARQFQLVVTNYPATGLYDDVIAKQYEIGDQLFQRGETLAGKKWRLFRKRPYKKATQVYSMVIENQPFTDAAAEAQYKVGLCHHVRKEHVEAAFEYRRVMEDYATSEWVDDASYGLAKCYYESARPPEYDQEPSQLAIEAMDAFLRHYPNDERGGELTTLRAEMRESIANQRLSTAKFYEKRRDFDAARIYYTVLSERFDDTAAGEKAKQWLNDNPKNEVSPAEQVLQGSLASS